MKNLENAIYDRLAGLLIALASKNGLERFGVSEAIYDEIVEEVSRCGETVERLTLPPRDIAFAKRLIRVFEMNDPKLFGVECELWAGESACELTLCAEFFLSDNDQIILRYKLIETQ